MTREGGGGGKGGGDGPRRLKPDAGASGLQKLVGRDTRGMHTAGRGHGPSNKPRPEHDLPSHLWTFFGIWWRK